MLVKFNGESPEWIALDYNNNQILDKEDKYFYKNIKGNFEIDIKLFANRITSNTDPYYGLSQLTTGKTKFTFFTENKTRPSKLITYNNHTKKELVLNYDENRATGPSLNNIAIIKSDKKPINILSGNIFLEQDLIIKDQTKILEGNNNPKDKIKLIGVEDELI